MKATLSELSQITAALERKAAMEAALAPLVAIAEAYDKNGLDEARPYWRERGIDLRDPATVDLLNGSGGKTLLTLGQCFTARKVVRGE